MRENRKLHTTRPRGTMLAVNRTHGESGGGVLKYATPEYRAWCGMIARCCVPGHAAYDRYGAMGVTVCQKWRDSYESFLADMGRKPSPRHSLDRYPNGAGNYEPGNCRWATWSEQARNKKSNRYITHRGETRTATDWATSAGISIQLLFYRLKNGWDMERAITTAPDPKKGRKKL